MTTKLYFCDTEGTLAVQTFKCGGSIALLAELAEGSESICCLFFTSSARELNYQFLSYILLWNV